MSKHADSALPCLSIECCAVLVVVSDALFIGYAGGGGMNLLSVLLTVVIVCGVLAGVGYGVYQFRIRSAMHQEIRAIMRQYMPLQETEGAAAAAPNGIDGH